MDDTLKALQQELDTLAKNTSGEGPDFYYLRRLIARAAEKTPAVQQHLTESIARKLKQLAETTTADTRPNKNTPAQNNSLSALKSLTASLSREQPATSSQSRGIDFDDFLREQENRMLQSMTGQEPDSDRHREGFIELGANRQFRQMQLQQFADNLVEQSIRDAPEDPGPLNPQMLAIRSLSAMRDLSPHYLNRFVASIDSLFWLEQTGAQHKKNAAKKQR